MTGAVARRAHVRYPDPMSYPAKATRPLPALAAVLALACTAALGCSFSYSSQSISDSSKSSSDSSRSGDETARLREDVSDYTVAWVDAGGRDADGFFTGVGELARQRGVSDWESDADVWEAIGRGLGRAGVEPARRVAYTQAWTSGDGERRRALERGFAAAH